MNKWTMVNKDSYPKDYEKVQVSYSGNSDHLLKSDAFAYRKDGEWYWATNDDRVMTEIIAWRENKDLPSYTDCASDDTKEELRLSTETIALIDLIEEKKKERSENEGWNARDEQNLAFLLELYFLRSSFMHGFKEAKDTMALILKSQNEMKEEKGLLL